MPPDRRVKKQIRDNTRRAMCRQRWSAGTGYSAHQVRQIVQTGGTQRRPCTRSRTSGLGQSEGPGVLPGARNWQITPARQAGGADLPAA